MKNLETKVAVASFMDAFRQFVSLLDDSHSETMLESFKKLKEEGKIEVGNQAQYWCGNHHKSWSTARMYRVNNPLLFYVVEREYEEISNEGKRTITRWVFVPEN